MIVFFISISPVYTVRFDVNNPDNNLYQQMSHLIPPVGGANVDGTIQNIGQYHKRNLNDWNFAEHFEPDVFVQVCEQIDIVQIRRKEYLFLLLGHRTSFIYTFTCGCLL